ncbi:MAG: hypothetical protein LC689_13520 [Myxococcales bacterium]|nr:hypothetical protein [Myxococcales bacterium]
MSTFRLAPVLVAATALFATAAAAKITKVQINTRDIAFGEHVVGDTTGRVIGQYERIVGVAFGEVDPADSKNAVIVDVGLAANPLTGKTEYSFDFYILRPLANGNHKMMYEPPNRGNKTWTALGRFTGGGNDPGAVCTKPCPDATARMIDNSFLLQRGYTLVWSGWDKAAGPVQASTAGATGVNFPIAHNRDGSTITGPAFEYIVNPGASYTLNYPAATLDKTAATLTHRVHLGDPPVALDPSAWNYNAGGTAITLVSGPFVSNDVYEFSYTAKDPTPNGLGFAAVRDFVAWLRYEADDGHGTLNPLAGDIQRVSTEISSQPGRLLNDFRHLGFNQSEKGQKVFDAMMQWIAAGDGINMNYRFSQPVRTERNRQDHLFIEGRFPFANVLTTDAITGLTDSRLAKCTATGTCPVSAEIYSANEYWVKAASLLHTQPDGSADLPDSPYARDYFVSSMQHGTGSGSSKGNCQQFQNPLSSSPVQRALFLALDAWIDGVPPPPTRVPRFADGTLVAPLPQSGMGFPSIPNVTYVGLKTTRYLFDYGPDFYTTGIATTNPPVIHVAAGNPQATYQDNPLNGPIYPSFIPKTDSDGNDIAGVRLPDVSVPLGTYTGWALRSGAQANDGCESSGQFIPFAQTEDARGTDPRPSVAQRYPTYDDYVTRIAAALTDLIHHRLELCEDGQAEFTRLKTPSSLAAGKFNFLPPAQPANETNPPTFTCHDETVPTAVCHDVTVAADSSCHASASIENGSSDADGDSVTTAQSPNGSFDLGATPASLTATDPWGNVSKTCNATVHVVDTTRPSIGSASASPAVLWPPNKQMVPVSIVAVASDNCDASVSSRCRITSVTSNEAADFQITSAMTVDLRADRSGGGKGRAYNVWVTCTDASGNDSTPKAATVVVPHDQGT